MKNAVIILNYNDADTTAKLIEAIKDYKSIDKLIVVDNRSTDDSFNRLSEYASERVDVLLADKNAGYAAGNNFGCRHAIKKYSPRFITIANPDVYFKDRVLAAMLSSLEECEDYGLCAPIVNQRYSVWNMPGYWGIIESLFLVWYNLHRRAIKKRLLSGGCIEKVGVVSGSFFTVKANAFKSAGMMDEATFLYEEENILARRLQRAGYKEIVLTRERYDHLHSASIRKQYKSKARAFKLFYPSLVHYNASYLHTNSLQNAFFVLCYGLAYFERMLYDIIFRAKSLISR